jgi:hypothetical protein
MAIHRYLQNRISALRKRFDTAVQRYHSRKNARYSPKELYLFGETVDHVTDEVSLGECKPQDLIQYLRTTCADLESELVAQDVPELPAEIWAMVLNNLDPVEVTRRGYQRVSRTWRDAIDASPGWESAGLEAGIENPAGGLWKKAYSAVHASQKEQNEVFRVVTKDRKNTFITGSAGTGKSHLLARIADYFSGVGLRVYKTSTTGFSARQIGGQTFHSFALFGKDEELTPRKLQAKFNRFNCKQHKQRLRETDVLILDEVSMLKARELDLFEETCRLVRCRNEPFGGIQMIFVGDFFQLPPVITREEREKNPNAAEFAFQSEAWHRYVEYSVELKVVRRQKDPVFVDCLANIRRGICTRDNERLILSRLHQALPDDGIDPTRFFATLKQAREYNYEKLAELDTPNMFFRGRVEFEVARGVEQSTLDSIKDSFLRDPPIPEIHELKIGAQVVLVANTKRKKTDTDETWRVNGSRGVVIGFEVRRNNTVLPRVRFEGGAEEGQLVKIHKFSTVFNRRPYIELHYHQIPLDLAWASTIHKGQGQTLSRVDLDLANCFAAGQVYVALSRARALSGITLRSFDPSKIRVHPAVVDFYDNLGKPSYEKQKRPSESGWSESSAKRARL